MRPSLLGRTIPHASHFSPTQRTFTTSLTRQSGPFSALTRQAAPLPSSSIDVKEVEPVEEADENVAEEEIDVEFEALEDARLDKALKPFETRELIAVQECCVKLTTSSNTSKDSTRRTDHPSPVLSCCSRSLGICRIGTSAKCEISNLQGKGIALPAELFNVEVRRDILHQCAVWWRASMRRVSLDVCNQVNPRVHTELSVEVKWRSRRERSDRRRRPVVLVLDQPVLRCVRFCIGTS